jgi:hypothetical protein
MILVPIVLASLASLNPSPSWNPLDYRQTGIYNPKICNCEGQDVVEMDESTQMPGAVTYWGICDVGSGTCVWTWTNIHSVSFIVPIRPGECALGWEFIAPAPAPLVCTTDGQCPSQSNFVTQYNLNVSVEPCPQEEPPGGGGEN